MNKIIASTGLVAFGAASLQAAYAPGLSTKETAKSWSVNAAVRGFYDSNTTTTADDVADMNGLDTKSWGVGLEVGAGYNLPLDQTFLGVDYTFGLKWYENRPSGETDTSHKLNLKVDHAFNAQWSASFKNSFVYSDEPSVIDEGAAVTSPFRTENNNIRNRATIDFTGQFTEKLGARVGYENSFYDYEQDAGDVANPGLDPSRSQLLDRMEHKIPLEGRYMVNMQTVALAGYQFGMRNYDGDTPYTVFTPNGGSPTLNPDWRDTTSHYGYLGVEHTFNPQLNGALNVGAQYTDYKNIPAGSGFDDDDISPYADGSLSYLYNPGSYLLVGYRHERNATDLLVQDGESDVIYLSLTHRISPKLNGNVNFQYQFSQFEQVRSAGSTQDVDENFLLAGVNLTYSINEWLSTELGYNYDNLSSDYEDVFGTDVRSYDRHVVYFGFQGSF